MRFIKGILEFLMEILETVVFIGSLFIVIYLFIAQPNQVKGESMMPTFQNGNYIFTSKVTYKMRTPQRGDVVVFHSPGNAEIEFIKRIIGLPGDVVMLQNEEVYVNGVKLNEPYTSAKTLPLPNGYAQENVPINVPNGYFFVMGDNRPHSSDSRDFGPIKTASVIGQVFYRYFPADKVGRIINPFPKDFRAFKGSTLVRL
ncbi:signal peptidase I [soil metagenome]